MRRSSSSRLLAGVFVSTLMTLLAGVAGPAAAQAGGRAPGHSLPAARVFHDVDQTVPSSNSFTILDFNSERFDTGDLHGPPNTSRLVAPIGGLYLVGTDVTWAPAVGGREVSLRVNGTTVVARSVTPGDGFNTTDQVVTTLVELQEGDFVQVVVRQNSGGDLEVKVQSDWSPSFWMTWVGPSPSP